jgi:putative transposase
MPAGSLASRVTVIARADEDALTHAILGLAVQYGRYGYRRICEMLKAADWNVGVDRV